MKRRLTLLLGLALTLALVSAPAVAAHGSKHHTPKLPGTIALPVGFQPEGIAAAGAKTLYVGSLADGAIWKGSARKGTGSILVAGVAGQMAVGLHLDWRGRLWVAGGDDQVLRVYNARTGALLRTYAFPTSGFLNDLVITRSAVYATDSANAQLAVVKLGRLGRLPDPADTAKVKTVALTGPAVPAGLFANGIVAAGGKLLVIDTVSGTLLRVNGKTGAATKVATHGANLTNGDGLLVRGRTLYVVRNQDDKVVVLKLARNARSAKKVGTITSPSLDVPSTIAFSGGKLWAVNARFGVADLASAEFWITRLPARK